MTYDIHYTSSSRASGVGGEAKSILAGGPRRLGDDSRERCSDSRGTVWTVHDEKAETIIP